LRTQIERLPPALCPAHFGILKKDTWMFM